MSSYTSLFRVLSPSRVQTKFEENSLPARYTMAYYLVLGEVPAKEELDYVEFDSSERVMILRNTIYEMKKNTFSSIDRSDLKLWKVDIPFDCENDKLKMLDNAFGTINIKEDLKGEKMLPGDEISKYLKNLPPSSIHILVEPPPPATTEKGLKRLLEDSDEGRNSKRAKPIDPNIISTARKIMEDIMKLDEDESNYSNPKKLLSLPFPYPEQLYFIIDQMNALDENDNTGTGELKIKLFGGFDEEEMKEWWNSHNPDLPAMDGQQIRQIEDITGKIPLFLNFLLESGHKNFEGNNHNWELHVQHGIAWQIIFMERTEWKCS
ncbi:unnamed protein product [Rhizophagus irregularis]|nr:unnamed protein product [Rhizophagus irregularis]